MLKEAGDHLDNHRPVEALECLFSIYGLSASEGGGPEIKGLNRSIERALRMEIQLAPNTKDDVIQDRFGLATMFIDQERHEEASIELREIVSNSLDSAMTERATAMLHRTNSAICAWGSISDWINDGEKLLSLIRNCGNGRLPPGKDI